MKITAPRRRAINFSGNMAARASDANNRAIKRPCFSAKEETELSSLRTQISQLKYSTANRTADASRTERRSRYLYLVARLSERKLNALKEKRKKHTQEGAGGRNRKRSGEVWFIATRNFTNISSRVFAGQLILLECFVGLIRVKCNLFNSLKKFTWPCVK